MIEFVLGLLTGLNIFIIINVIINEINFKNKIKKIQNEIDRVKNI